MYILSNQTTIECCLSISICFILFFCQSISSQTSITFLFVLNYEFPLVFPFPFVFAIPFIPLPFLFTTIPDMIPFSMIKCGYGNRRGVFSSVSVRFHPYSTCARPRHESLVAIAAVAACLRYTSLSFIARRNVDDARLAIQSGTQSLFTRRAHRFRVVRFIVLPRAKSIMWIN
jgi:hypothetical protein